MPVTIPRLQRKPRLGARLDRQHPLSSGLVGCWLFNEGGGGKLWDISGNGNHGTLTDMDPSSDWVASPGGGALDFDGSNDCVSVSHSATFNFGSGDFSVLIRTLDRGAGTFDDFVSKYNGSQSVGWVLQKVTTDRIDLLTVNGSSYRAQNDRWSTDRWHTAIAIRRSNTTEIWVDAVKGTDSTMSSEDLNTTGSVFFCQNIGLGNQCDCKVEIVDIWSRALSASEIHWLYTEPYANVVTPVYRRYFVQAASSGPVLVCVNN